ncbi:alpha-amylase family glycosyl hydrolase [Pedobacter sp. SYSU D00535]|uniref:alpha-amylase family glycosyl hydrolase n=1 Tax=Pedobacter sp. SYSU D00535 TaxID=2810308 RepID=UPI001A95EAB2|nr:alpha-amylase family glycosyl hydrolase [Pedobacter sp. SYSU D00535]
MKLVSAICIAACLLLFSACKERTKQQEPTGHIPWYKTSVIYNVDIDAFKDSDGDGIGDFRGLIQELDYLKWLGINVIWLSPFQPTPDKDDGYDVADYYSIDKRLGTKADFDTFIAEAKKRNMKVIMDLVLNHTSLEHPWFQQARRDTSSRYFSYYVWSRERPKDWNKGMGFPKVEKESWTFDSVAKQYYFHRFYTFQPDLNVENKEVQKEMKKALRYWLEQGLDGYRLDAVPFIIDLPKTGAENPENKIEFLTEIRKTVQAIKPDALLLGEANVEIDKNIEYFGEQGERLQMMFNFFGNQFLFYAFASGNVKDFVKALEDTKEKPVSAQWAYFLRNHDEIDLGRLPKDKLNLVYAKFAPDTSMRLYDRGIRRRLAPMFSNNKKQLEMAYSLLFSLPGTPVIRYGEEIGMGDDQSLKERLAVRTPMQWDTTANAGFSSAKKTFRPLITLGDYNYKKLNVESQKQRPNSLLHFTRRLIELRKKHPEIGLGAWKILKTKSASVMAIRYDYQGKSLVMVHNFSEEPVHTAIDIETPAAKLEDLLSHASLAIKMAEVDLTLPPYGYKWYRLTANN